MGFLAGEKMLVTGASGFIGAHLCRRLGGSGGEIHAISRMRSPSADGEVRWWQGDLADTEWVHGAVREIKPEVIFHLAGEVTGARTSDRVLPTFRGNLMSTLNLMTIASEIGCRRFVLAGSLEEAEPTEREAIPCSPYAAAKSAGSAYARMFHSLYQFPVVIARIFMVYGPAQKDGQKLIPYVIHSLLQGQAPKLSSSSRLVDWIYVDDVVDGLLKASQAGGIDGLTIDLGSGKLVPIRRVVELLAKILNSGISPAFGALPDRVFEQERAADTAKSKAVLGWAPATSLEDGLQRTVDWYESHLAARV